ncbi:MAG TPA: hypothetical protein VJG67_03750 [Candidatus Paceibacterota bacterium]
MGHLGLMVEEVPELSDLPQLAGRRYRPRYRDGEYLVILTTAKGGVVTGKGLSWSEAADKALAMEIELDHLPQPPDRPRAA